MDFELVLPCYNESKSLRFLIERCRESAQKNGMNSHQFNLILVENGSKDNSREVLRTLKNDSTLSDWFRVVEVPQNRGYGFGIWSGLKATKAHVVGWSHADQQCDPDNAFRALSMLKDAGVNNVIVKGVRKGRSVPEKIVSRVFDVFAFILLRKRFYEINAQPKVFSRELLDFATQPPPDFSFDLYMLFIAKKCHYRFLTFDVDFPPRLHGLSNWAFSLKNRMKTIMSMIRYMYYLGRQK